MWDFTDYKNCIAFYEENGAKFTYEEIDKMQSTYANYMCQGKGITLLICSFCVESIILYIACIQNKIPIMVVDAYLSEEKIHSFINTYTPKYIWHLNTIHIKNYKCIKCLGQYKLYVREGKEIAVHENLALLLLTSGSTGSEKSVRISYENIRENMYAIVRTLEITQKDIAAMMLPLCYSYGLSVLHSNLAVGATLLIPKSKIYSKRFWDFFCFAHGTSICGVPYTYEMLKKLKFHNIKLPTLRLMTQAGGALGKEEQKYFLECAEKNQIDFAVMYGQTEATARISSFFLNKHKEKLGSVGKPLPGGRIEIRDKEADGRGEIFYTGKNVTMGYATSYHDLVKGDENRGILHTGDIGFLDNDGYLYITGRKHRIAKPQGIRINLDDLQGKISDKAEIPVVCIEGAGKIYCFVEGKHNSNKILKEVSDFGLDKRIYEVIPIEKIPRGSNGKILYHALEKKEHFIGD